MAPVSTWAIVVLVILAGACSAATVLAGMLDATNRDQLPVAVSTLLLSAAAFVYFIAGAK